MRSFFFSVLVLSVFMVQPIYAETYYAKVENGLITNVIVADKSFVDAQPGKWVQTFPDKPGTQYAGIGYFWNDTSKKVIPTQHTNDLLNLIRSDINKFAGLLSSDLASFYHPKMSLNSTNAMVIT